jgi:hypothetical protein
VLRRVKKRLPGSGVDGKKIKVLALRRNKSGVVRI